MDALAPRAKEAIEGARLARQQVADRFDVHPLQPLRRLRADAPDAGDREWRERGEHVVGCDDGQAVGLFEIAREFGEELVGRDADGGGEALLVEDHPADVARDRRAVAEQPRRAGDVEERLIDTDRLHLRREALEDVEDRFGDLANALPADGADDRVRTEAQRHADRHRASTAVDARLVAGRADHAARLLAGLGRPADEHGFAAQLGKIELLDRREERVHVDVENRAGHGEIITRKK